MPNPAETKEEINVSIKYVLKEAWHLVYGMKWTFLWLGIITPLILIPLMMMVLMKLFLYMLLPTAFFDIGGICLKATYVILQWYLVVLLIALGARRALGLPFRTSSAIQDCKRSRGRFFVVLLALTLMYAVCTFATDYWRVYQHAFVRNIVFLPFLYLLLMTLTFVVPLIALNDLGLKNAFTEGFARMNKHLLTLAICWLVLFLILSICLAVPPLQIGLLWFIPMLFAMIGVFFRDAF